LRQTRLELVIGSRDGFVTDARLADEEARLRGAGLQYGVSRYFGGHAIKREPLLEVLRKLAAPDE
jgi:hypothetical protein